MSDMCLQFVCIKQTNIYGYIQVWYIYLMGALLFIFMLYDIYAFCQRFAYEAAVEGTGVRE